MSFISRCSWGGLFRRPIATTVGTPNTLFSSSSLWRVGNGPQQLQSCRGIRVRVINGNLERALAVMTRKMVSSGIERLITRQQTFHLKNSEKKVLARKRLERRIRSQELSRKLRTILIKKVRGL